MEKITYAYGTHMVKNALTFGRISNISSVLDKILFKCILNIDTDTQQKCILNTDTRYFIEMYLRYRYIIKSI